MPAGLIGMLITSLIPVGVDALKGAFNWLLGGAGSEPANVDERIRLMEAEVKKLDALSKLDAPGAEVSRWVADLRGSFRYIAAGVLMVPVPFIVGYAIIYPSALPPVTVYLNEVVGPVFGFMFGDRLRVHLRKTS